MTTTRRDVYEALDSEREYQAQKWAGHTHSIEEYVLYMEHYLMLLRTHCSMTDFQDPANVSEALSGVRKVAALGVACMEEHGAPARCA